MLLALLFVSTAVATPLLGTEQCARGPPYWCQNVKTASLCGAVPHCQQNVWSQPQMKSVPCDLCKEVMVVVDQLLKDNSTEAELLGYMEKTCQLIPDEGVAAECKEMVDNYYPILMGIIKGELEDPGVVCGALGLCVTQQEALAKAQLMSNEIPQVDLTQRISPLLLNIPQLLYPEEIPNKEETETPKEAAGDVCTSCVQFITDIQNEAKTNASFVNSLIAEVESQCDLLGPDLSDMCKQYVSEYAPLIIQQLMSMQPKDICSRAGFCSSGPASVPMQTLVAAKSIPLVKTVPATMVKATLLKPAKKMVRARESPQCAICEFVMRELESMIQDHATEEEVVQAVEKVCNILPSTLTAQCKDLIETYGQAIIELLVQEADPKTVCALLGLCNGAGRNFVSLMEKAEFEAGGFCDVCKMAVRYVDAILEKNATQAEIEEAVKKVCNFLPDEYKTQCDQLVEQYEPLLVELLLQTLDPDFVCMKLGACPEVVQKLLGLEQCSWGPSFWCKNMETASLCNAVDHCKRHVWS